MTPESGAWAPVRPQGFKKCYFADDVGKDECTMGVGVDARTVSTGSAAATMQIMAMLAAPKAINSNFVCLLTTRLDITFSQKMFPQLLLYTCVLKRLRPARSAFRSAKADSSSPLGSLV